MMVDKSSRSMATERMREVAVEYGEEVVELRRRKEAEEIEEITITFDEKGGARWRSLVRFENGEVSASIKCPAGNTSGLNCSFYLSSLEGDKQQDEIDFEFLGKDKRVVQTNFYAVGVGGREILHDLPFDVSEDFHIYTIRWSPSTIQWLIDGLVVRHEDRVSDLLSAFPSRPMFLYASVWNASYIDDGRWAGPYYGTDAPYACKYKDVFVPSSGAAPA